MVSGHDVVFLSGGENRSIAANREKYGIPASRKPHPASRRTHPSSHRDKIRDPRRVGFDVFSDSEVVVAFAGFFVGAFPIDMHGFETGFEEQFADFGDGPHAPVVGEGVFEFGAVGELEVDVETGQVCGGIETCVFPDIGEVLLFDFVGVFFLVALGPAEHIENHQALAFEVGMGGGEIGAEGIAGGEEIEAEVLGGEDVGLGFVGIADIGFDEFDAMELGGFEFGEDVLHAPGEGFGVEIDADGGALGIGFDPFGANGGGAAEIFAEDQGFAFEMFTEDASEEVDFKAGFLNAFEVEFVFVGFGGEGRRFGFFVGLAHGGNVA